MTGGSIELHDVVSIVLSGIDAQRVNNGANRKLRAIFLGPALLVQAAALIVCDKAQSWIGQDEASWVFAVDVMR